MKWEMVWDILRVAGVDQGQVGGPGVPLQVHGVVQDGNNAHKTDQDEVENGTNIMHCTSTELALSRIMTDSHFSLVKNNWQLAPTAEEFLPVRIFEYSFSILIH